MTLQLMDEYFHDRVRIETRTRTRMQARVTFTTDLQGPPEAGHGGGVTAMLLETVRLFENESGGGSPLPSPMRIDVALHREIPLEIPLAAKVEPRAAGWHSQLWREDRLCAEATVFPIGEAPPSVSAETRRRWEDSNQRTDELPGYEFCLACGLRNSRGAQVRFKYNEAMVWKHLRPQAHFRCADGGLFPGYLCIVADEIGWWLGALRAGECGLTSRVTMHLGLPVAFGIPLLVLGDRSAVTASDTKGRMWHAQAAIVTPNWDPVATAEVQFAASRAFTKVMLPGFLPAQDPAALRHLFPRFVAPPKACDAPRG